MLTMANKSNWKGFEKEIAEALGGVRRLRTMESYGKEAPDVYFSKKLRKKFPALRTVVVECKKRRGLNIYRLFNMSKLKYSGKGKRLILASRRPATAAAKEAWHNMKGKLGKRYGLTKDQRKNLKLRDFVAPLITVELDLFVEMWDAWIETDNWRGDKKSD